VESFYSAVRTDCLYRAEYVLPLNGLHLHTVFCSAKDVTPDCGTIRVKLQEMSVSRTEPKQTHPAITSSQLVGVQLLLAYCSNETGFVPTYVLLDQLYNTGRG